jgi:hypothetical protein
MFAFMVMPWVIIATAESECWGGHLGGIMRTNSGEILKK